MKAVLITLLAGSAFWVGTVHEAARKMAPPFKVVRPQQLTPALTPICENLTEIRRACTQRARSSLIQKINPNSKGSM